MGNRRGSSAWRRRLTIALTAGAALASFAVPVAASAAPAATSVSVPDVAADAATAAKDAKAGHKRVLDSATQNETTQTFANPDGSWTTIEYAQPVRVRQGGTWTPVDTTLVKRPDGSIAPKAADVSLALNPGGRGSAARPIVAAGAKGDEIGLTWPTDLPAPTLSGDTATYPNVLPGVDLAVRATVTGYAETLVVRTAKAAANPALAHLTFGLYTKNTHVTAAGADPRDGLAVTDPAGAVLFGGDASRMWDSAKLAPQAGPDATHRQASMAVQVSGDHVTVSPDREFLTDPATVYPVSLDPDNWCTSCGIQHHDVVQSGFPTAHNYDATAGALTTLKAGWENSDRAATSRSYIQMNTAAFAGTVVTSATLNTTVAHTWNCSGTSPTDLYTSNPIDGNTTWAVQPSWGYLLSSNNVANCHDAPNVAGQFDATAAAKQAASSGWPNLTLVLAADNERNDVATWREFGLNPYLQVDYDSYPNAPTGLTMQNGTVPCAQGDNRPWVFTRNPQLAGQVSDPDGGTLNVAFGLDEGTVGNLVPGTHQTNNATTVIGTPGPNAAADATFSVPDGWIPHDGTYTWLMSATDGQLWSANSPSCEFTVDSATPLAPSVRMTGNAPVHQGDTAQFSVLVGLATAGLYDIDHFIYTTDGSEPSTQGSPTAPALEFKSANGLMGATASLSVTAVDGNQNYIKVRAVNRAGTPGPDATCVAGGSLDAPSCSYHVQPLTPSVGLAGAWAFDEMGGRTLGDTANTTPGNAGSAPHPATLVGNGDWVAGYDHGDAWSHPDDGGYSDGVKGALTMDGSTAYAQTAGPVLDTTKSFTVSAWAKISDTGMFRTVVSQDGNQASGFYLQYSQADNAWAFTVIDADAADAPGVRALSTSPPQLNTWTHLVGTYDRSTGLVTLYVNGIKQKTAVTTAFGATGPLVVGGGKFAGNRVDYFAGQIDDVQAWQRVLSGAEVHDLATAAAPLAHLDLAEGCANAMTATSNNPVPGLDGYWAAGDGSGSTLHDSSQFGADATLAGGYSWTTGRTANSSAVAFDGSSGYAATAHPVVNTGQSFTVSAWVKPSDLNGYYAAVAQHGAKQDAFQIRYSHDVNRWIFGMTTSDDNSVDNYHWAIGASTPQAGAWTLVTGVFDSTTLSMKLYVNGKLDGVGTAVTPWNATGPFTIGTAVDGLNLFKGTVSQVQAWGQALTADQVAALAGLTYYDSTAKTSGTASGGIALGTEPPNSKGQPTGCAARVDNTQTGQVAQTRPANFRTDQSYTVEAWVYHQWTADDVNSVGPVDPSSRAAFSVDDATYSPILLGYREQDDANGKQHGKWGLLVTCSSTVVCGWLQFSDADAADNTWTHLAATYDAATGQAALYVNGVKQNTSVNVGVPAQVTGRVSTGNLWVGRGTWNGQHSDPWQGGIAGVRLYAGVRTQNGILADRTADDPGGLFGNSF